MSAAATARAAGAKPLPATADDDMCEAVLAFPYEVYTPPPISLIPIFRLS